jgi:hypothetical protein
MRKSYSLTGGWEPIQSWGADRPWGGWYDGDGSPKDAEALKDAREKDFEAWTVLGALVMASAFDAVLDCPDIKGDGVNDALYTQNVPLPGIGRMEISDRDVAAQLYLICMSLSAMLALKCVNDNMIKFLRSVGTPVDKQECIKPVERSLYPLPIHNLLESFGLKWGFLALYQSIYFLCSGFICGMYLKHGLPHTIIPCIVFNVMYKELRAHAQVQLFGALTILKQEASGQVAEAAQKPTKARSLKRTRSKSPAPKRT